MEMTLCQDVYKISHSHFLGGPPEWTQLDRDKAIWKNIRTKEKCSNCGTREAEWDPLQGGDRQAYTVRAYRCRGCEVKAMYPEALLESLGKGVYLYLGRNDAIRGSGDSAQHQG
jgi:hypothetical protein